MQYLSNLHLTFNLHNTYQIPSNTNTTAGGGDLIVADISKKNKNVLV